jgi:DnaK suppressor protein
MNHKLQEELATELRRKRQSLLQGMNGNQQATTEIIEEREAEIEENAQKERLAGLISRLTEREQEMIQQIDAALERMDEGAYGECVECENGISPARLRAMPTALLCIDCATEREKRQKALARNGGVEGFITNEKSFEFETSNLAD